jgi:hypothetical protein
MPPPVRQVAQSQQQWVDEVVISPGQREEASGTPWNEDFKPLSVVGECLVPKRIVPRIAIGALAPASYRRLHFGSETNIDRIGHEASVLDTLEWKGAQAAGDARPAVLDVFFLSLQSGGDADRRRGLR